MTIYAQGPANTRNNTWTNVTSNFTVAGCAGFNSTHGSCNATWNTAALTWEDSSSWQFKCEACNASQNSSLTTIARCANSTAITAVLHTANPRAPSSLTPATGTTDTDGKVTFKATIDSNGTRDCTLKFRVYGQYGHPGKSAYDMDKDKLWDYCQLEKKSLPEGQYQWYVTADDDTNTTDSSATNKLTIDISSKGIKGAIVQQTIAAAEPKKTNKKAVAALVIIVIVAMFIANKKKKK